MSKSVQLAKRKLIIRNFNHDFLLIQAEDDAAITSLGKQIFEKKFDFAEEVIVTERELCIKLNDRFDDSKIELLKTLEETSPEPAKTYKLPVFFADHEDWSQVETTTGLNKQHIIKRITASPFSIAMFGFLPGFLYLEGLEPALHVPRKSVPSKYVKANSIAIGGKYIGLYALDSPGGWHVIGQMPIPILQTSQLPPVPFQPGDSILFHPIDKATFEAISIKQITITEYNA